jgi:long-subunit fatty acid transport protein
VLLVATCALRSEAQAPTPSPSPLLDQDVLDLRARSNVVQGSGARAYGMAGAFLARPDDATAASWNPAGLSYLRTLEVSLVAASNEFSERSFDPQNAPETADERSGRAPDFAAVAYPIQVRSATGAVQLSFQRVFPFDGDQTFDNLDRPQSTRNLRTFRTSGGFDVLALGTGLQVRRGLRLGVVVNRWLNGYEQDWQRTFTNRPTSHNIDFDFEGWNVSAGAIWSPVESLNVGAVYKSPFTADVSLTRTRTDPIPPPSGTPVTSSHSRSDLAIRFPAAVGLGLSWRPSSPLTLSADFTRTNWSDGRIRNMFFLPSAQESGGSVLPGEAFSFPELTYPDLRVDRTQVDTQQFRAGAEYVVIKSGFRWPLRAGYFTDRQLFRALDGAVPTFDGFTIGTGVIIGRVLLDFAYLRETGSYRDLLPADSDPGHEVGPRRYSVRTERFFVSLIYRHR